MKKKKPRETPVIVIPKGYSLLEYLDTDDSIFEGEEPILKEEVIIKHERTEE